MGLPSKMLLKVVQPKVDAEAEGSLNTGCAAKLVDRKDVAVLSWRLCHMPFRVPSRIIAFIRRED